MAPARPSYELYLFVDKAGKCKARASIGDGVYGPIEMTHEESLAVLKLANRICDQGAIFDEAHLRRMLEKPLPDKP